MGVFVVMRRKEQVSAKANQVVTQASPGMSHQGGLKILNLVATM